MGKEFKGLYDFGEFRLDATERRLVRNGEVVPLTLKVFETLLVLVQRSGRLVGKDELMKEVWSDSFVEEANVARHVWILRKALGDDEGNHRYIETVPKLGYRFIAPVRELVGPTSRDATSTLGTNTHSSDLLDSPTTRIGEVKSPLSLDEAPQLSSATVSNGRTTSNETVSDAQPHAFASQKRTIPIRAKLAAIVVVVSIAILAYTFSFRHAPAASEPPIKSLAVLPLKSLSGVRSDDYLGLGIAATIITRLNQSGTIMVRPYSAVQKYAGQQIDSLQAAQQLKVDSVLDGTVQLEGDRVRVSVNLMRTEDSVSLLAEDFDVRRNDILTMQDEVAQKVATRLRIKLRQTNAPTRTIDPEAYDYYMQAKSHGGLQNAKDNDAAIELLERAIKIDPNFAAAYADLAAEYRNKGAALHPQEKEWEEKAYRVVKKALELDNDLAEAHVSYGLLLWTRTGGFPNEAVIGEFRRALELNPNLDEAHHQLASVYNHIGLLDKGHEEIQKAIAINPANAGARFRLGVNLTYRGEYDQALFAFGDPNKFNPNLWAYQMSFVLFQLGRKDEAAAIVEKYLNEYPPDDGGILTSMRAMLAASAGNTKQALENIKRAAEIGKDYVHFHHTAYTIASTYALMNKRNDAIEWLRATAEGGFPCYPLFERDPNLNNLREDPNFQAFMKTLKERWERYKATV